mmetsp:Transcript_6972/g.12158  ORF Transcript_6972/g.12158 Transcript_6972/m.12158 type:complete len:407 (-) Transcript_6972:225-1445(-)
MDSQRAAFADFVEMSRSVHHRTRNTHGNRRLIAPLPRPGSSLNGPMFAHVQVPSLASLSRENVDRENETAGAAVASGPTTRSRKRKHQDDQPSRESREETQAAATPSSKRKPTGSPPQQSKRRRVKQRTSRAGLKKPPPNSKEPPSSAVAKTSSDDQGEAGQQPEPIENENCCICMCDVEPEDLSLINGCEHRFCFGCIEKWAERENTCPLCKIRFTKIDRVNKKRKKGVKNSKKVKQRDQRSDLLPGAAIEGLLANLTARGSGPSLARIIFGVSSAHEGPFSASTGPSRTVHGRPFAGRPDWEDSDDDLDGSPLAGFFRVMNSHPSDSAGRFGLSSQFQPSSMTLMTRYTRTMTTTTTTTTTTGATSRSYASNINDSSAGTEAENPLEIEDDSDEEVEIVSVRRT